MKDGKVKFWQETEEDFVTGEKKNFELNFQKNKEQKLRHRLLWFSIDLQDGATTCRCGLQKINTR